MDSRPHRANLSGRPSSTTSRRVESPPLAVEEAIRGLLQRRWLLVSSLIVSLVAGLVAAYFLRGSRYTYEGVLLYTPNDVTAPYFSPPDLSNLVHIVHSPTLLTQLRDQFHLNDTLSTLKRDLQFELVPGGDTVVTRVVRSDPTEAMNVLNGAMSLFVSETRRLRKQTLERFVGEFEADLKSANQAVEQATAQVQGFLEKHGVQSIESLADTVTSRQHTATELDMELQMADVELTSAIARRDRLSAIKADQTKQDGDAASDSALANVPLARAMDRRHLVRDQILQEQQASSYSARLQFKQKEFERAKELHGKGLISDAELERVEGELAVLRAEQNSRVVVLQQQLSDVEQRLTSSLVDPSQLVAGGPTALTGLMGEPELLEQSIALLDLEILGATNKVERLSDAVGTKQGEVTQINQLQKEIAPLLEAVRIASAERDRLQNLAKEFGQAVRSNVDDLKTAQAATPAIDGVRSNAPKIFAAVFLATLGLLIAPALYREWREQSSHSVDNVARHLGVPVLADLDRVAVDGNESAASLALRIRRRLPSGGSAVLFTGTKSPAVSLHASKAVAQAAAQSGEAVVFVDLLSPAPRPSSTNVGVVSAVSAAEKGLATEPQLAVRESQRGTASVHLVDQTNGDSASDWSDRSILGLADFLRGAAFDVDQLTRSSEHANLCFVNAGTSALTSELLASNRLGDFFKQLKAAHSLVVIAGPLLEQRLHVECLSDAVDGIVLACPAKPFDEPAAETLQALVAAEAPIIGVIA